MSISQSSSTTEALVIKSNVQQALKVSISRNKIRDRKMAAIQEEEITSEEQAILQAKDLAKALDELVDIITTRFSKITNEVFDKMDEMALRLDELEEMIQNDGNDKVTAVQDDKSAESSKPE